MRKARMRKARMGKARIIFDRIVLYLMAAIWLGSILGFTFHLLTQLIFLEKCTVYIVHCALGQTRAIPNPLIPTCSICLSPACEIFVFPSALFSQSIPICDPQTCFMPTFSHLWPSTWTHQAIYSPPSPNAGCKNVNPFLKKLRNKLEYGKNYSSLREAFKHLWMFLDAIEKLVTLVLEKQV